jgi:hypothetical protein
MEPVCKPMARRWQMPFASSRGYGSLILQHDEDVASPLRQNWQAAVVYFVPSGLDLQRSWKKALEDLGVVMVDFVRIGLRMRRFLVRFIRPVSFVHTPDLGGLHHHYIRV